mmetsp:Transcript_1226/g.3559  ORF Transcript_1226/g.3559 Transcript_1226/m.3559 type:complete len:232 (+) Transcript_1226:429-1124(+)
MDNVDGEASQSNPHLRYTSLTLSLSSRRSFSCMSSPMLLSIRFLSKLALHTSLSICCLSSSILFLSESVFTSIFCLVSRNSCLSSSRACSVSCEFWIRKRLLSSSWVKMLRSCMGSSKYMGISSSRVLLPASCIASNSAASCSSIMSRSKSLSASLLSLRVSPSATLPSSLPSASLDSRRDSASSCAPAALALSSSSSSSSSSEKSNFGGSGSLGGGIPALSLRLPRRLPP